MSEEQRHQQPEKEPIGEENKNPKADPRKTSTAASLGDHRTIWLDEDYEENNVVNAKQSNTDKDAVLAQLEISSSDDDEIVEDSPVKRLKKRETVDTSASIEEISSVVSIINNKRRAAAAEDTDDDGDPAVCFVQKKNTKRRPTERKLAWRDSSDIEIIELSDDEDVGSCSVAKQQGKNDDGKEKFLDEPGVIDCQKVATAIFACLHRLGARQKELAEYCQCHETTLNTHLNCPKKFHHLSKLAQGYFVKLYSFLKMSDEQKKTIVKTKPAEKDVTFEFASK